MIKRAALAAILLSMLAVGVGYAAAFLPGGPPPWAAWAMAFGGSTSMVATMALGAVRDGRLGGLALPLALVLALLLCAFGAVLTLPPADPADPALWLGLPPRAAVVLYGVGLLPLLAVPVAYALTFDRLTLSAADLERLRAEAAALRAASGGSAPPDTAGEGRGAEG